jgi:hypothetical protein
VDENNIAVFMMIRFVVAFLVDQIFAVNILAQWLLYVEFTLHGSRDILRRRYGIAMIPLAVAVVLMILSIPIAFMSNAPFNRALVYAALVLISNLVLIFYIIAAYAVLFYERKRNRIPEYIRLTPTILCVLAGFVTRFLPAFFDHPVLPLFFALGLIFADYYLYRRLDSIDPKTGFFNRRYLPALIKFSRKNKLTGATVFRFKVQRGSDVLSSILKIWAPDQCKTVAMGDGEFLMISGPVKDSLSERFIELLTEQVKNRGIPMEAAYETDYDSAMDAIISRYV